MARKISMKEAINEALDQEMARDPSVIVMGEDIVGGAGSPGERDAWGGVLGVTKGCTPSTATGCSTRRFRSRPISARPSAPPPAECAPWPS